MSTSDLAIFSKLSDDVLEDVFQAFTYNDGHFWADLEPDTYASGSDGAQRRSQLLNAIMPSCKRFYAIGVRVLWRSVVVRTRKEVELVKAQASGESELSQGISLWSLPRRLEVRFDGPMELESVACVIKSMEDLEIVIFRDHRGGPTEGSLDSMEDVVEALCPVIPKIRRIQVDSPYTMLSCADALTILDANPCMQTFRVADMTVGMDEDREWTPPTGRTGGHMLSTLSLGTPTYMPMVEAVGEDPVEVFLDILTSSFPPLAHLKHLDILHVPPAFTPFIRRYGHQLRVLRYAAIPMQALDDRHEPDWISHCPNLVRLHWVITNAQCERPPSHHSQVEHLVVEYLKAVHENQWRTLKQLEDAVDELRGGGYTKVKEIEVVLRGQGGPTVESFEWVGTDEEVQNIVNFPDGDGWSATVRY